MYFVTYLRGAPWRGGSSVGPWSCPAEAPGPEAGRWGTSDPGVAGPGSWSPGPAGPGRGGCRYWTSSTRGHTDQTPGGGRGAESSKCGYLTCNRRMVSSLHGLCRDSNGIHELAGSKVVQRSHYNPLVTGSFQSVRWRQAWTSQ